MAVAALALAQELSRKTGLRCAAIASDGAYDVEIVGAEHYQSALQRLAGGRTSRGVSHKCMALLVPEPANPRDPRAVLVQISGHDVGYLHRDLGPVFSRELAAAGCSAAVVGAVIVGGWNRLGGNAGHLGVKLDLVRPFRIEGVGDIPAVAETPPSSNDADTKDASKASLMSSSRVVARRLALAAANFLAGMGTRRLALVAAIFLAGMATGAGLIFWLRPTLPPPVAVKSELPVEPDAKAAAESPTEMAEPATAAVPLPRRRPDVSPGGVPTTGQ